MGLWRVRQQQFRDELKETNYPFGPLGTLTAATGQILPAGLFLDAAIHPIGGVANLYLSQVVVSQSQLVFSIGDAESTSRATGTYIFLDDNYLIPLLDVQARPAGILVADTDTLREIAIWGDGTYTFSADDTAFVASVCIPTPEQGVRGFLLDDGTFLTNEAFLVGGAGVVLRTGTVTDPATGQLVRSIRVDAVGDPLFRRAACGENANFTAPGFIRLLRIVGGSYTFDVTPDAFGNVLLSANNAEAHDTVLRARTTSQGLIVETVGGASS